MTGNGSWNDGLTALRTHLHLDRVTVQMPLLAEIP